MSAKSRIKSALFGWILLAVLAPSGARASFELDNRYSLETIGYLKSWDNVDGIFSDYVAAAYEEYFAQQSRFRWQDISRAYEALENSKIQYRKLIEDEKILKQVSRTFRVNSLLRTKIYKEGPYYRFVIDWVHMPYVNLLATETFKLEETRETKPLNKDIIKNEIKKSLDALFKKVPFLAHVTGRDDTWVTVNAGSLEGIRAGDTLVIGSLEEVKTHPLLEQLVEWKTIETGRLVVDKVEEKIAFGKVQAEEPGHQITRYQKVLKVLPKPPEVDPALPDPAGEEKANALQPPRLGWVSGGTWTGSFSRQYSNTTSGVNMSGSGTLLGAKVGGELWLTRNYYFARLAFGYGF
ncbi:MAG: hypothetical protein AB7F66_08030, partial [Bacteriovoracia bacterium]